MWLRPALRPARAAGALCIAAAAGLFTWQAAATFDDWRRLRQHQQGLEALERAAAAARLDAARREFARHERITQVARQLARPWGEGLDLLETVASDVSVQRVLIDADRSRWTWVAQARTPQALSSQARAWSGDARLADVRWQLEQAEAARPSSRWSLVLSARWPATAGAPLAAAATAPPR